MTTDHLEESGDGDFDDLDWRSTGGGSGDDGTPKQSALALASPLQRPRGTGADGDHGKSQ